MNDTADIVQDTIISAMRRLEAFESRHQGALQAYLRQAVMNRIRDVIRHHKRRPEISGLSEGIQDEATSPLEAAIGAENLERHESALQRLKPEDREAIIGRLEMLYPATRARDGARTAIGGGGAMAVTRDEASRRGDARCLKPFSTTPSRRLPTVSRLTGTRSTRPRRARPGLGQEPSCSMTSSTHREAAVDYEHDDAGERDRRTPRPHRRSTPGANRLANKVGEGSYGSVYRAWDSDLERDVAIKILHRRVGDTRLGIGCCTKDVRWRRSATTTSSTCSVSKRTAIASACAWSSCAENAGRYRARPGPVERAGSGADRP